MSKVKFIELNSVLININLIGRAHKLSDRHITFIYSDGTRGDFKYDTNEERDADFDHVRFYLTGYCDD